MGSMDDEAVRRHKSAGCAMHTHCSICDGALSTGVLTADEVRAVVRDEVMASPGHVGWSTTADAIAARVAEKLAGRVVASLPSETDSERSLRRAIVELGDGKPQQRDAALATLDQMVAEREVALSAEERTALRDLREELRNDWEGMEGHDQPGLAVLDRLLSDASAVDHVCPSPVGLNKHERAVLAWLRNLAAAAPMPHQQHDPVVAEHTRMCQRSVALLDRLLATEPQPAVDPAQREIEQRVLLQSAGERVAELEAIVAQREAELSEAARWRAIADRLADSLVGASEAPDVALAEYQTSAAEYARSKAEGEK